MRYERPETLEDAVGLLSATPERSHVLAGGTDLLVRMKNDDFDADLVVDIKRIAGMGEIARSDAGFVIGAAVPCAKLAEEAALVGAWPGVVEAANLIGSTQIQSRCTMTGNLCNAGPAADSVPALVAADARVKIVGPEGNRIIPARDVPVGPGQTSLAPGEIVAAIVLPEPAPQTGSAYLRFIPRTEMDIAVVGAAVTLTQEADGKVAAARVALGAVGPRVIVPDEAAQMLVGTTLDDDTLARFEAACSDAATPIDDKRGTVAFRKEVAGVLARRAAKIAYDRAGETQ
ncbi:FAD binding domain-containing protein [Thalassorhabdomicrobium marinisediminis]|uniref:FAD binding domain-containing protein n=1 Tax=Thalassorhabdomicrobium marinisediminis TaxID=2170577 RepID=UPI00249004C7|nr:xanthine dehydrogenase family protein subunit M [Thalassorhabdomicrobium marinisediminis]